MVMTSVGVEIDQVFYNCVGVYKDVMVISIELSDSLTHGLKPIPYPPFFSCNFLALVNIGRGGGLGGDTLVNI